MANAKTMLAMAQNSNGEVHVADPAEKSVVRRLEKRGLVEVRRTEDKICGHTEWWYKLANPKSTK